MNNKNNNKNYRHRAPGLEMIINFGPSDKVQDPQPHEAPATHERPSCVEVISGFRYISLGSGSSGNASYVGNSEGGVLVDAGIEMEIVFDTLARHGVTPAMIKGIIITHDHLDHVRYVYRYARQYKNIRIYCTPRVLNGLLRRHNISRRVKEYQENIYKEIPFKLAGFTITAFETSHDGTDNMGFDIAMGDNHFVIATDTGFITERAHHYMSRANYLMIECNYDLDMLNSGRYPEYLKNRVRGERGHLDNKQAAQFLVDNYHKGLRYVFMCHLSKDNNTPQLARETLTTALEGIGLTVGDATFAPDQRERDVQLYALPRFEPSLWFVL